MIEQWGSVQRQRGNIAGAEIAKMLREKYGDETLPKVNTPLGEIPQAPEIDLTAEWARQSSRFVELGYHSELDLTIEEGLMSPCLSK